MIIYDDDKIEVLDCDLIGQLAGIPVKVVQAMVEEQVAQGNKPNITVFQRKKDATLPEGGFAWYKSALGTTFWSTVINHGDYSFFEDAKKSETKQAEVEQTNFKKVNEVNVQGEVLKRLSEKESYVSKLVTGNKIIIEDSCDVHRDYIFIAYIKEQRTVIVCTSKTFTNLIERTRPAFYAFDVNSVIDKSYVYLTLEDISNGKGVGVPPELIKISK
jgi:hypothetical protein